MISLISPRMEHRDGVPWWNAPIPRRWHRCSTWTRGELSFSYVHRCACGAISSDGRHWQEKNSRRKSR